MINHPTYLMTHATHPFSQTLALAAMAQGANMILNTPLKQEYWTQYESQLTLIPMDVKNEKDVEALYTQINGKKIAGIIHCLPPLPQQKSLLNISLEDWNHALAETLHPLFYLARQFIEEFITERISGRLIILQIDECSKPNKDLRQASLETALLAFCRSVAKEYGRRAINCNIVRANESQVTGNNQQSLAELILFLLQNQANYITGEAIDLRETCEIQ